MTLEADYERLAHGVGLVELEREVLEVSGPDAATFLQGQCSQDLLAVGVGDSTETLILRPDGKIELWARVQRPDADRFLLDVEAGFGDQMLQRIARFKLRSKVDLELFTRTALAVRGPASDSVRPGDGAVLTFGFAGWSGFDLFAPAPQLAGVERCGAQAYEALRIEHGIPRLGRELDEKTIAAETQLIERTVSFTKGCYTGQELVARIDARGANVARHLRLLIVAGNDDPDTLVGAELHNGEKAVGSITSAAYCPGLGAIGALGYVHRSVEVGTAVLAGSLDVEVRALPAL